MSVKAEVEQELKSAFSDDLTDFIEDFVLERYSKTNYNATTGEYTTKPLSFSSRGLFEHYKSSELLKDDEIKIDDVKLFSISSEISTDPEVDDIIFRDTTKYIVKRIKKVYGVAYEFQLRGI